MLEPKTKEEKEALKKAKKAVKDSNSDTLLNLMAVHGHYKQEVIHFKQSQRGH